MEWSTSRELFGVARNFAVVRGSRGYALSSASTHAAFVRFGSETGRGEPGGMLEPSDAGVRALESTRYERSIANQGARVAPAARRTAARRYACSVGERDFVDRAKTEWSCDFAARDADCRRRVFEQHQVGSL